MMILQLPTRTVKFVYRKLKLSSEYEFQNNPLNQIYPPEAANLIIAELIKQNRATMISRFGTPESSCLLNYHEIEARNSKNIISRTHAFFQNKKNYWDESMKKDLNDLVGFFPTTDENLNLFSKFYIDQIKYMDAIGVWGFVPGETFLINKYCKNALRYNPTALEPYFFDNPWSYQLKHKKVLVIHPFARSIELQYNERTKLFSNLNILPDFELKTIKAVQSIAGTKTEFNTWFDALQWMKSEMNKIDYEIAIIGAGSYGLPLSAYAKKQGKIAIHIGGATQILFGIKGKRWDDHPVISRFYNEHWVRPLAEEVVPEANKVENGCYW